eukprot:491455-Prymnesium_polylepis.1
MSPRPERAEPPDDALPLASCGQHLVRNPPRVEQHERPTLGQHIQASIDGERIQALGIGRLGEGTQLAAPLSSPALVEVDQDRHLPAHRRLAERAAVFRPSTKPVPPVIARGDVAVPLIVALDWVVEVRQLDVKGRERLHAHQRRRVKLAAEPTHRVVQQQPCVHVAR